MPGHDLEMRLLNKKDKLIAYAKDPASYPEMAEVWEQFEWIESKLRSMHRRNVLPLIKLKYGYERSWANRLIREVMSFSGMIHKPDAEYLKMVHIERLQRDLELASAKQDFKAVAALSKEYRFWLFPPGEQGFDMSKLRLQQFFINVNLPQGEVAIPIETYYKLKDSEKRAIDQAQEYDDLPGWEELEADMNSEE